MNFISVNDERLLELKKALAAREERQLSPLAARSKDGMRRIEEEREGHRLPFATDTDRVLHSRSYTRYIDKTQVFYLVRNDHITHRVLHVQLVSKIARTVGRFLSLNEDLIEAIALGHDIGHPPFGHDGEKLLAELCREHDLPSFQHNLQSVVFLENIEKRGRGLNLTLQVLDGIMCHDGEIHQRQLEPSRSKTFADFEREFAAKEQDHRRELLPMTLEGCVVRLADTIAYIGRDIEDAIELGMIEREEIPPACAEVLGNSNGSMVYRLVTDLIASNTTADRGIVNDRIAFSPQIAGALHDLKQFNYQRIYLNPLIKQGIELIGNCYRTMFTRYLDDLAGNRQESPIFKDFLAQLAPRYRARSAEAAVVRDFIAGMTDDYFLRQAADCGCPVPKIRQTLRG
ncbi:deoxyguanosinetriphosphate triphosphohydrolase family protein [Desulfurivibrio dismutans]|uniref:deoxyguanosinetriphosphate triphosphohydrolase family protein n=1 Tax=Desulfurivibrio dismutans TaxID=1398908 RepID=UPI0023DBCC45|nr:HD domain-containing protein [Desulfurivibrio alkaliphilus]MDF1614743.1 HD domain-containing protein [Desulfurivibrio alkaliphilus]